MLLYYIPKVLFEVVRTSEHFIWDWFDKKKNISPSFCPKMRQVRTTMMAILPPTSPTTFMGGFSLAAITARK